MTSTAERVELAKRHLAMLDSKNSNDPRALAMRALISHYQHGKPSLETVLAVAEECGVRHFDVFEGLE